MGYLKKKKKTEKILNLKIKRNYLTALCCFKRFLKLKISEVIKWSSEEDSKLRFLILKCSERDWQQISSNMKIRSNKQCKRRWNTSRNYQVGKKNILNWKKDQDIRII